MTQETTQTLTEFITRHNITMAYEASDRNPNNTEWHDADHWCVHFTRTWQGTTAYHNVSTGEQSFNKYHAQMTTYFSIGFGHNGKPPLAKDVLQCLVDDASYLDMPFSEWAIDMGYDPDSRKAEKIYKACERGAAKLKRFLGEDLYQELLQTERE